ncbi:tRNase Z TRZ3, mitochondrial [Juglans microcarpa x Juglans regia]|uniref:tRNase Z TRZ3, mitochondrial n=1 Tax=Juglans microcarpa x Juglans regia TaxID=2249226 RepID=UPI001B7E24CC|nr:tRNase Z TRZ3, mitochondrial [Juglans microcarpa x Juglans regia]
MPQVTNLRLLFYSSFPLLSPFKPSLSLSVVSKPKRHHSLFTVLSLKRHRKVPPQSPNLARRNNSTLRESKGRDKGVPMEETTNVGFNKRRAEGRDKSDRPLKTLQLKVRTLNPANTISYVQILGTGMDTQDTSPSVLLFFDKQRFIFNAGEGLQRFCTEHKIKLSKIDHIFLSRVCSETAGGLPGLLLTLAGMGEEGMSVNVWGPSDMKYLVDAMRSFIPNAAMVHTRSFGPTLSNVAAIPESSKFPDPIVLIDDEVVKISAIILQPSCFEGSQHVNEEPIMQNASEKGLDGRIDHVSKPHSPNRKSGSAIKPGDMSVIYVCELPEIKGKFDPAKAMALGLKPGPKYRELQLGNSVKSDRQKIMVHPSDVMGPSVPGPIVFLVDCPTESHLEKLLSIQSLSSYYADHSGNPPDGAKTVTCIIHLSPASVISSSNYQRWMERFNSAQHILAGHEMRNVEIPILKSSARIAARLNYLCPQFFPAPGFWSLQQLNYSAPDSITPSEGPVSKLCERISAENLLKFTLRPYAHLGLDRACIPCTMAPSKIIEELLLEIPEIEDAAQHVSQFWHRSSETVETTLMQDNDVVVEEPWLNENNLPSCLENIRRDDLEIVLLGTGSSQPSKYRNVSSVYINLFSKGSLLLDCGEGTLGQLKRRYGVEGADNAVRGLRCIWISHIHADHHTGLARILALRRNLLEGVPHEPILVVGPRQLKKYLDAYQRLEDLNMQFLDCKHTTESSWDSFEGITESKDRSSPGSPINAEYMNKKNSDGPVGQSTDCTLFARGSRMQSYWKRPDGQVDNTVALLLKSLKKVLSEAGLEVLISFNVVHCPQAFGVMLKAAERINGVGKVIPGWKIVYSGDTRPCPELIEASRGATVLIHEATFEDGMHEEAVARNHSTTKEAVEVGNSAGVYRIILTHFSQRYPKIPIFDETHMHKTCIAFDMMSVNIADLPVLPKVLPYLKLLFKNEMIVDESDDVLDAATAAS